MNPKDFAITCFISILLNCAMKRCDSSLKCCFEILSNHSVSYNLSEPPGAFCTPTWSEMEFVVVDEHGNVDKTKVVYLEPQKLILKGNIEVKQVTYRTDCPRTGHAYTAKCHDPCVALGGLRTTQASNTTQKTVRDHGIMYAIVGIITIIIIIMTTVICLQRNKCQALRCKCFLWKAVPKNETPIV